MVQLTVFPVAGMPAGTSGSSGSNSKLNRMILVRNCLAA